jgi:hypothetical protein
MFNSDILWVFFIVPLMASINTDIVYSVYTVPLGASISSGMFILEFYCFSL